MNINNNEQKLLHLLEKNFIMNTKEISKELPDVKNIPLFLNRMKKKDLIVNISRGYYVYNELELKDIFYIIEKIYLKDNTGVISGLALLNKYGYVDQVPVLIKIKSTSSAKVQLLNATYKISRLDSRIKNEPKWSLEMYELIKQLKIYDMEIDYVQITKKFIKRYSLARKDLEQLHVINFEYYYESLKYNNRKHKIIKTIYA